VRVDRFFHRNAGLHRNLTEGVSELKIDIGPGYSICYSHRGEKLLLLLAGGNKAIQAKDIEKELELSRLFK
jgi:putative addiction module killer protein